MIQSQAGNSTLNQAVVSTMLKDSRAYLSAMLDGDAFAGELYELSRLIGGDIDEPWIAQAGETFIGQFSVIKSAKELAKRYRQSIRAVNSVTRKYQEGTHSLTIPIYRLDSLVEATKQRLRAEEKYIDDCWPQVSTTILADQIEVLRGVNLKSETDGFDITRLPVLFSVLGNILDDLCAVKKCAMRPTERSALIFRILSTPSDTSILEGNAGINESYVEKILFSMKSEDFVARINTDPFFIAFEHALKVFSDTVQQYGGTTDDLASYALRYARNPNENTEAFISQKIEKRFATLRTAAFSVHKSDESSADENKVGDSAADLAIRVARETIDTRLSETCPSLTDTVRNRLGKSLLKLHTKMGVDLSWLLRRISIATSSSIDPDTILQLCTQASINFDPAKVNSDSRSKIELSSVNSLDQALTLLANATTLKGVDFKKLESLMDPDQPRARLIEALSYLIIGRLAAIQKPFKRLNIIEKLQGLPFPEMAHDVVNKLCSEGLLVTNAGQVSRSQDDLIHLSANIKSRF